ncbi:hypothetical protein BD309DRAFT_520881 [Dichomitus squalens]|nr:hypothetical protein BD309DRAFT_520881 [Dichomitus squalens]
MFISTLALSWGYNSYLSSVDREDIQTDILIESVLRLTLDERARKYDFKSRTGILVVFACLAMPYETDRPPPDRMKILNALLLNDTRMWKQWKQVVEAKLTAVTSDSGRCRFVPEDGALEMQAPMRRTSESAAERRRESFHKDKDVDECSHRTACSRSLLYPRPAYTTVLYILSIILL